MQIPPECRMVGSIVVVSQDAAVRFAAEVMVDHAVAVYENCVARVTDPVAVFGIAIILRKIFPVAMRADPRQPNLLNHREIDQSAAPNHAVALDVVAILQQLRQPRPAGCQYAAVVKLPEIDEVI